VGGKLLAADLELARAALGVATAQPDVVIAGAVDM
jgi:hypothetical protein